MDTKVKRVFVEKKHGFDVEAQSLFTDLKENLGILGLDSLRIVNRYDISGITEDEYIKARNTIFSEPTVDNAYDEFISIDENEKIIAIEYLPGQYDQRADSAAQCIQILTEGKMPLVKAARLIIINGIISEEDYKKIKSYCINPVESQEASLEKPQTLENNVNSPDDVIILNGFTKKNKDELTNMLRELGLAMSIDDIMFCQKYFIKKEGRDPSITEIKMLDTYWSDHCRHTTFLTEIDNISFDSVEQDNYIENVYKDYLKAREYVYGTRQKKICLMDMATIAMKELKKKGKLNDLDESDEINACSIVVPVDVDGKIEEWLVMFKNETHNHPTEIEPFGGAATCLGGAIRDPLSGRAYVYQAMRITGSGDPRTSIEDTLPGKLPQRKITQGAAAGYSSYGNQVGLATGQVVEVYHEGYIAKRMEVGAVIGATPRGNVVRKTPAPGDIVVLLGGRTGRDGCGGATGSSKVHTEESLESCGAEVQKGNPPTERKIQRLFRNSNVTKLIKKCNDFGAGGISVAVGELAPGLDIDLDAVPKKYDGLDGTELAISESQERMAVVIEKDDLDDFINYARKENLEAVKIAVVTDTNRLRMRWRGKYIVDISRDFLDSNGANQKTNATITNPDYKNNYFEKTVYESKKDTSSIEQAWMKKLENINICSQKGLVERFDSTIGSGTVVMPFGGRYQLTPSEAMVAKIPVLDGETTTGTIMTYGYDPYLSEWSPFHGALFAIIEAVSKIVASGGNFSRIRLSLQEYFERLGDDPLKWGKPLSALLGAYHAQSRLGLPAIGGKDSMSGTFNDISVPPTLIAFAVSPANVDKVITPEFKRQNSNVVLVKTKMNDEFIPDFEQMKLTYRRIYELIHENRILSAHTIGSGGLCEAISKMSFGNGIGFDFYEGIEENEVFYPNYGSLVLELSEEENVEKLLNGIEFSIIGRTTNNKSININGTSININSAIRIWSKPLEGIFPTNVNESQKSVIQYDYINNTPAKSKTSGLGKPRVFIPVFPGTNCEYDTKRAFEIAGGLVDTMVFRNLSSNDIDESLQEMSRRIEESQIIMIPGGFSAGDEPEGSGKFIATIFRNSMIKDSVMNLIKRRDGLILGICNGFQALIKLGLVPFGEIIEIDDECPTLTYNTIGRHVSTMVQTRISSNLSPWFNKVKVGDIHTVAVSHGEGRFVASHKILVEMSKNGQIATQYVDLNGKVSNDIRFNPNGSIDGIEGITSPDGRILGKMGHSERKGKYVAKNIIGNMDQKLFESGVEYFI